MDYDETKAELGRQLKQLRQAQGLTQAQVAEAIGVSLQAYQHWEAGRAVPTVRAYRLKVKEVLGLNVDEFIQKRVKKPD